MNKKILFVTIFAIFSLLALHFFNKLNFGIEFERYIFEANNLDEIINKYSIVSYYKNNSIYYLPNHEITDLLINFENAKFYLKKYAIKENNSIIFEGKNYSKEEFEKYLKEINAENISESEINITFSIFLFSSSEIKDFKIFEEKAIGIKRRKIVLINITLNETQAKILQKLLENVSIFVFQFERFLDAKVEIKYNNKSFEALIPLSYFLHKQNLNLISFDEKINVKELEIYLKNFEIKYKGKENYFKIFNFEFLIALLFIISSIIFYLIIYKKILNLNSLILYSLTLFSLFNPIYSFLIILPLFYFVFKDFKYEKFLMIFSLILTSSFFFAFSLYFSILIFLQCFLLILISEILKKYSNFILISYFVLFLSAYFFNPQISITFLLSSFSLLYKKFFEKI